MGKHRNDGTEHIEGDLFDAGPKKEQLSTKREPFDRSMAETSTSPIETF